MQTAVPSSAEAENRWVQPLRWVALAVWISIPFLGLTAQPIAGALTWTVAVAISRVLRLSGEAFQTVRAAAPAVAEGVIQTLAQRLRETLRDSSPVPGQQCRPEREVKASAHVGVADIAATAAD